MEVELEIIRDDRRSDRRYRVDLELQYRLVAADGSVETGSGTALDMSRGGVRLLGAAPLPPGRPVELVIEWPFRLQNVCQLELVITGQTVRVEGALSAVRTERYRFRTRGERSFDAEVCEGKRLIAVG